MRVLPPPDQVKPEDVAQPIYEPTASQAETLGLPPSNGEPAPVESTPAADPDLDALVANLDAPADPLDELVAHLPEDTTRPTAWRAAHSDTTPEQQAQALDHEEATGIPAPLAVKAPQESARAAKLVRIQAALEGRPGLHQVLADPRTSDLAKDDTDALGRIEDGLKDYASLWWGDSSIPSQALAFTYNKVLTPIGQVARDEVLSQESHALKFAGAKGLDIPWVRQHIAGLDAELEKNAKLEAHNMGDSFVGNLYLGTLRMGGMMARYQLAGVLGGWAGAAVTSESGPGAAAGATIGSLAAMGAYGYYEGTGDAWWRLVNLQDPQGRRMNPILARVFAEGAGVLNGAFMAGLGHFGVKLPFAQRFLARFAQDSAEKSLVKLSGTAIAKKALTTFTKNEAVGVGTMAALTAANGAVEETAKATSNVVGETHLEVDPLQPLRDMRDGLGTSARDFLIISAFGPAREVFRDVGRMRTSRLDVEKMEKMVEATDASKLAAISPKEFQKALEKMVAAGEVPANVYVPREEFNRLAQEQNKEPEQLAASINEDGGASYRETATTKADVEIPLSQYLAKMVKSGQHERFKEDIKLSRDGYTPRQAKENAARVEKVVQSLLQKYEPGRDEAADAVYQDYFDRVMATGKVPRNEADRNARLTAATFGNWGRMMGMDPVELYHRQKLNIFGPELEHLEEAGRALQKQVAEEQAREPIPLDDDVPDFLRDEAPQESRDRSTRALMESTFGRQDAEARNRDLVIDPITGLHNRRGFEALPPPADRRFLARFGFEGKKAINDVHGHETADGALRAMARALRAAGIEDGAKWGSDLAAWVESPQQAEQIAATMARALDSKSKLKVTHGVAERTDSLEDTFKAVGLAHQAAEDALQAKGEHGHRKGVPAFAAKKLPKIDFNEEAKAAGLDQNSPEAIERFGLPVAGEEAQAALLKAAKSSGMRKLAARFSKQAKVADTPLHEAHRDLFVGHEERGSTFETIHVKPEGTYTDEGFRLARKVARKKFAVSADARGIKAFNDPLHFDKKGTDRIISAFNRALVKAGGMAFDVANPHGDEFYAQGQTKEALHAFFGDVKKRTDKMVFFRVLEADPEKNLPPRVVIQEGVHFAYGIGESLDAADRKYLPEAKRKQGSTAEPVTYDLEAGKQRLRDLRAKGRDVQDVGLEAEERGRAVQGDSAGGGDPGLLNRGGLRPDGEGRPGDDAQALREGGVEAPARGAEEHPASEVRQYPKTVTGEPVTFAPEAEELAKAREMIDRLKKPELRDFAHKWLEYVQGYHEAWARLQAGDEAAWEARPKAPEVKPNSPERRLQLRLERVGVHDPTVNPLDRAIEREAFKGDDRRLRRGKVNNGRRYGYNALEEQNRIRQLSGGDVQRATSLPYNAFKQEGHPQTETPAFKSWFGDSKVVNEKGAPLVVYHGTAAAFDAFDPGARGSNTGADGAERAFFFAGNRADANIYAEMSAEKARHRGEPTEDRIIEAYVKAENPLVLSFDDADSSVKGKTREALVENDPAALDYAEEHGYDAVIWPHGNTTNSAYTVAVFRPEQIKSATGNRGTFDASDTNILHQRSADLGHFSLKKEGDRGEITFTPPTDSKPRTFNIHLFHNADASTLAHETFHFLNQVMGDLAQLPEAEGVLRADYDKLIQWMGYASHKERTDLTAAARGTGEEAEKARKLVAVREERATHAWEQYLLEGKAPSAELAGTFARFSRWLGRIYGHLQKLKDAFKGRYGEDINLTDEVRGIFDRLLATEEATTEYRQRETQASQPFQAALAGMTPEEQAAYQDTLRKERDVTEAELFRRLTEEDAKAQRELVKQRQEAIRGEVESSLLNDTAQRALYFLETGSLPESPGSVHPLLRDENGKPYKLDRAEVEKLYGKDAADDLPSRIYAKKGDTTRPPDMLAGLLGFQDGKEMVAQLRAAEPRRGLVEAETAYRVRQEFGPTLLDDVGGVAEAVVEAAHNDKRLQRMLVELRALRKLAFPKADPRAPVLDAETAAGIAEVLAGRKTVGELLAGKQGAAGYYLRSEREARKKAFEAADKGKTSEAYGHQETAVLNFMLYRETLKLRERLKKGQDKLLEANKDTIRRKLGTADRSYRDAHDAILHVVGLREEAPASSGPAALDAFVATAGGNAQEVGFDVEGLKALMADPKPWKKLTVEEAQNVLDASTNIRTAARRVNEVLVLDKTMTRDAFIEETAKRLEGLPEGPKLPRDPARETLLQKVGRGAQWLDAILTNTETMVGFLTKGDTTHPLHRLFVEGYLKARNEKADLARDFLKDLLPKWEQLPKEMRDRLAETVDIGAELPLPEDLAHILAPDGVVTRSQLLMMALNLGNEGNKDRLLGGYGWTEEQVRKVLDRELSRQEWQWAQDVWDALEKLYPRIAKLEEEETGLLPGKVEATPITLPDGTVLRGGYFPAKYDPRVPSLGVKQEEGALAKLLGGASKRATTLKSHTKKRAERYEDVVNLDWSVVPSHVGQVLHDLAFRRYVKETAGILIDKRMQLLLQRYLGKEGALQLDPWLKAVANAQADAVPANLATGQRIMGGIRNRVAVQVLGHNLPVALGDFSNLLVAGSTWEVRPDHMAKATAKSYRHWNDIRTWALEQSPELRFRHDRVQKALAKQLGEMGGAKKGGFLEGVRDSAFVLMEWSDRLTATPIWLGRFDEAVSKGATHEEAVALADGAVRKLFPPEDIAEASPLTRDRRGLGGMVMFYGYMSKMYQLQRGWARELHLRWRDENVSSAGAVAKFTGKMLALSLSAGLIGEWLSGRGEEPGEPWWKWVLRKVLTFPAYTVPFMGPLADMALGKQASQRLTPGVNFLERTAHTLGELAADPTAEKALFDALSLLGFGVNVPTRGLTQNGKYLLDTATGQTQPRGAADVVGGAIYGKRPKQPDNPLTDIQDVVELTK